MANPQLSPELAKQAVDALARAGGNATEAAKSLGLPRATFINRVQRADSLGLKSDAIVDAPEGYRIKGTSTLYDATTGEARLQWVKTTEDQARQAEAFKVALAAMTEKLPRIKPTDGPKRAAPDLMACYPVGDHHLGQLSWHEETESDYDLSIAEQRLAGAVSHLVSVAPSCEQATIAVLGDLMHYDSFKAMTPTSGNLLDADSRFPKMVRAAIRSLRHTITCALHRHQSVRVIIEIGNHDLSSSIFLMECLANIYENEPRVTVDTSPRHYHFFSFGKCLVMTHHGHGPKMQDLPLIMATDKPEEWGRTQHRYIWTGHIHHWSAKDFPGCSVESFRVLAPTDAWAAQKGYRPISDMKAIVLHREHGEVARHTVSPRMLVHA